jgi:hypothetical protein
LGYPQGRTAQSRKILFGEIDQALTLVITPDGDLLAPNIPGSTLEVATPVPFFVRPEFGYKFVANQNRAKIVVSISWQ